MARYPNDTTTIKNETEVPACGQCGSTALHHVIYGMPTVDLFDEAERRPELSLGGCCIGPDEWTTECVSCGQRRYLGNDSSEWTTGTRPHTAGLVTRYATLARERVVDTATAPAVSYAGLWLLLAHLAPVASDNHREAIAEAVGVSCDEAAALAEELLTAPHSTIATALGAWSRVALDAKLAVALTAMPDQAGLNRWASDHTRGLINEFPVAVSPETVLIVATALVLQPRWAKELWTDDDGMLLLNDGLQTIVDTQAAGRVAVAKPFSEDGVDVISVIAAHEVSPQDVWRAVDEVVDKLNQGALWHERYPSGKLIDGHSWTVSEVTETFINRGAPTDYDTLWRSHLPEWSEATVSQLADAPGVAEIVAALREAAPALAGPFECIQTATAAYDESGFTAAAVTTLSGPTGRPTFVERTIRRVELMFDRPHAVIAIARGGPWEGVPVFNAWVTPSKRRGS
jgi:hypothetical protein